MMMITDMGPGIELPWFWFFCARHGASEHLFSNLVSKAYQPIKVGFLGWLAGWLELRRTLHSQTASPHV